MDEFERPSQVASDPLAQLLEEAVELARQAGELTLRYFRSAALVVEWKTDGTPVTKADRQAERLIREQLELRHPGDGILAKRSQRSRARPGAGGYWTRSTGRWHSLTASVCIRTCSPSRTNMASRSG